MGGHTQACVHACLRCGAAAGAAHVPPRRTAGGGRCGSSVPAAEDDARRATTGLGQRCSTCPHPPHSSLSSPHPIAPRAPRSPTLPHPVCAHLPPRGRRRRVQGLDLLHRHPHLQPAEPPAGDPRAGSAAERRRGRAGAGQRVQRALLQRVQLRCVGRAPLLAGSSPLRPRLAWSNGTVDWKALQGTIASKTHERAAAALRHPCLRSAAQQTS